MNPAWTSLLISPAPQTRGIMKGFSLLPPSSLVSYFFRRPECGRQLKELGSIQLMPKAVLVWNVLCNQYQVCGLCCKQQAKQMMKTFCIIASFHTVCSGNGDAVSPELLQPGPRPETPPTPLSGPDCFGLALPPLWVILRARGLDFP